MADFDRESMLEMFVYEMNQLIESLETTILEVEETFTPNDINEVFRVMHTIKGSAAMMMFENISTTAHKIEDMFFYLRENPNVEYDAPAVADIVFISMDFIKEELVKISQNEDADGDNQKINEDILKMLTEIKGEVVQHDLSNNSLEQTSDSKENQTVDNIVQGKYKQIFAKFNLEKETIMAAVRAYSIVSNFENSFQNVESNPKNILEEISDEELLEKGFSINIKENTLFSNVLAECKKASYIDDFDIIFVNADEENTRVGDIPKNTYKLQYDKQLDNMHVLQELFSVVETMISAAHIEGIKLKKTEEQKGEFILSIYSYIDSVTIIEKVNSSCEMLEEFDLIDSVSKEIQDESLEKIKDNQEKIKSEQQKNPKAETIKQDKQKKESKNTSVQQVISVNVTKLDQLLNLMRELVISEAIVTQNPDLEGLVLDNFHKDARRLHKIINEVQDLVMSMRMIPISNAFFKMHRIVRDMARNLSKDVDLVIIGEETEVDKNIIEAISDPLMHIIRNCIDHGLEDEEKRIQLGKPKKGTVTLEAENAGSDVYIYISDDGGGINREKVMEKAKNQGILKKDESEYTGKEIDKFILQPGFSTNEKVTNYSGRGVGMDVVVTNLANIGGTLDIDSTEGVGTQFIMKIPLTLAIIDGMNIKLGTDTYTIPITNISQSFKAEQSQISIDPNGNEIITVKGAVYNFVRLSEYFGLEAQYENVEDGIVMLIQNSRKSICILVDELIGEYQVVVKALPSYVGRIPGICGCTLLGNGDVSLIISVADFF